MLKFSLGTEPLYVSLEIAALHCILVLISHNLKNYEILIQLESCA